MYKNILHATDLREDHFKLCEKAHLFAEQHKARLYFLHAIEIPISMQWAQNLGFAQMPYPSTTNAETVMNTLADALKINPKDCKVAIGNAYVHILEMAKTLHADLIILGSHQRGLLHFAGSTTDAVIHHATCDVLIVNTP